METPIIGCPKASGDGRRARVRFEEDSALLQAEARTLLDASPIDVNWWRERIVGLDERLPLLNGRLAPYINLDNAASTPPFREVLDAIHRFLPYYSSVHRGTGFKSRLTTAAYDDAHDTIARFVGADYARTP